MLCVSIARVCKCNASAMYQFNVNVPGIPLEGIRLENI